MRAGVAVLLTAAGAAGATLAAYLLRGKPEAMRWVSSGMAFAAPWTIYGVASGLAKPVCSFLFISDTHGPAEDNRELVAALLRERDVSFVVHGGDIADIPSLWPVWWDQPFGQIIARWTVHAVSGNHDISTAPGAVQFTHRFGILPKAVSCGNVELFFLPWDVFPADVDWLWKRLQQSLARWRVLVTHRPVWTLYGNGAGLRATLGPALSKVHLVLAGHGHVFQDSVHDGVRQVIEVSGPKKYECPAGATGCVEGQTGFVRVDVYGDRLKVTRRIV